MKRFIRVVALCMAIVSLFTVFASASEIDSATNFVNLLDYSTPNGLDTMSVTYRPGTPVSFTLPDRTSIYHVDILFRMTGDTPTGVVYSDQAGRSSNLTFTSLGNQIYRAYGHVGGYFATTINIDFTQSTSSSSVTFLSFRYTSFATTPFAETGVMTIGSSPTYTMSSTTTSVTHTWSSASSGAYIVHFSCPDWEKYDRLSFFIWGYGPDVNSIVGRFGNFEIPVEVTYLNADGWNEPRFSIMVSLDLSSLDRTKTDIPEVEISGMRRSTDSDYSITLLRVTGYIDSDALNPLLFYFRNLASQLNSLFDGLVSSVDNVRSSVVSKLDSFHQSMVSWFSTVSDQLTELLNGSTTGSQEFEDNIASQATEMEDISETLDSVTKPPVEDFDISIDEYFKGEDTVAYSSPLGAFFENSIFIVMFLMSMIAVTVSYGLYGKR